MDQCQVSARRATYLLQKLVGQGLLSQQGAVRGTTYTWPETDETNNVRFCTVITPLHIAKTKSNRFMLLFAFFLPGGSPTARSKRRGFVPCDHEYMNFRGSKFSKSRGGTVDVPYFLSKYEPDALRYYLTATAPETRDTDFAWEDFVERNNSCPESQRRDVLSANEGNELVATWGDLVNRMLGFAYKRFDGHVPEPGDLDAADRALLAKVEAGFQVVGDLLATCKFRAALGEAMALAREANIYIDRKAPWFQIKDDRAAAATTVYVILRAVDNLKTLFAPFIPHTGQQLHEYLGYDGQLFGRQYVIEVQEETRTHEALTYDHSGAIGTWTPSELPPGQALRQPAPLFKKLDESLIDEEYARLES
jgi:methionyl-tRNA synthetase